MKQAEFRGCDSFVAAKITKDDKTGYTTGSVIEIAPIASVAKTSEVSSETHFYDNTGMIQIKAVGVDTVTFVVPAMFLEKLAIVTGAYIDPLTGAYMSGEDSDDEYAVGYRLKLTDGSYRYVWRLKGTFSGVPDENSNTESNSVDTQNQTVVFTGTKTIYAFSNGGARRDVVIDERDGKCDCTNFFATVQTPDTISALAKSDATAISLSASTLSLTAGGATGSLTATTTPTGKAVSWLTSNSAVATVEGGVVTPVAAGTAVITAVSGNQSAACTVTVAAGA
jgi:phi13 family phage major tail protein